MKEYVLHIDGDCFFASCEVARKPYLKNKPVVVGQERGIATALTYEAKKIGVKRGDPIFKIKKDFPMVSILSSHFELYNFYAKNLKNILKPLVENLEVYSIDECFATITKKEKESLVEFIDRLKSIKELIQKKLGVTYSFGVSLNKTLAKVASKKNKPNGFCVLIDSKEIQEVLGETLVENIWGIGYQTARKLKYRKIYTALEFSNANLRRVLKDDFTKPLEITQEEILGKKILQVGGQNEHQKSLQQTRAFIKKTNIKNIIFSEISRNVEAACGELVKQNLYAKSFSFFVKRAKGQFSKSISESFELPYFTQSTKEILKYIEQTFDKFEKTLTGVYKSSGVYLYNLKEKEEIPEDLFSLKTEYLDQESKLVNLINDIKLKHGYECLCLASSKNSLENRENDKINRDKQDDYIYGLPYPFLGFIKD